MTSSRPCSKWRLGSRYDLFRMRCLNENISRPGTSFRVSDHLVNPPSHLSGQALWASYGGQYLLLAVPLRKHASGSISHGSRPNLSAKVHPSTICPQTSFEHAQDFVRVSCGYLHADVIAKHQQEARKGRNLLV